MPSLACRTCGRVIYTAAPLNMLFAEEQRCPRCGAMLADERRSDNRRKRMRRANGADEAGARVVVAVEVERRVTERRQLKRRRDDTKSLGLF